MLCFSMVLFNSYNNTIMLDSAKCTESSAVGHCAAQPLIRFSQPLCGTEPRAFQSLVFCPKLKTTATLTHINHYIVGYQGGRQATSTLPALIQIALMAISCGGNAPQRKQWWQKRLTYLPRCDGCA